MAMDEEGVGSRMFQPQRSSSAMQSLHYCKELDMDCKEAFQGCMVSLWGMTTIKKLSEKEGTDYFQFSQFSQFSSATLGDLTMATLSSAI